MANITPAHKKDEPTDKENYRPVSVLPLLSKVFERLLYDQLSEYLEKYLNTLLCGFRKAHSTQHVLFKLLQARHQELDKSGFVGTILMNLSKAYDCLSRELLVATYEAYGIDKNGLNLMHNYLSNRKQRTKINSPYSDRYDIARLHVLSRIRKYLTLEKTKLLYNAFVNSQFNYASAICMFCCKKDYPKIEKVQHNA